MKRTTWLIIVINVYGIAATALLILGILKTPIIIIPFLLTPSLTGQLRNLWRKPGYRPLAIATVIVPVFTIASFLYLALST